MAQYPVVSSSSNDKIIQYIDEDSTNNNNLAVKHNINLDSDEDARLGKVEVKDRDVIGNDKFDQICAEYGVAAKSTTKILVIFKYDFFTPNPIRGYRTVKTFQDGAAPYLIPGKPKVVVAGIGVSKTGGEAL